MAVRLRYLKEKDFLTMLESGSITDLLSEEIAEASDRYNLIAININLEIGYVLRHAREKKPRTWRLDNLALFIKKHKVGKLKWAIQQL